VFKSGPKISRQKFKIQESTDIPQELVKKDLFGMGYPYFICLYHNYIAVTSDYGVMLEDEGHTLRGLFIIDDKGILRQITMNDLPVGRSVDETLRLVQAFQYTDQHGEVCPANWTPGKDTLKPDPEGKLEYFEKNCNKKSGEL